MELGTLFWYKVGTPKVTMTQLLTYAEELGMATQHLPRQILPVDVFRRLSGPAGVAAVYTLAGTTSVKLALRPAKETKEMLSRVVTRTVITNGQPTGRSEVADFVFHMPPRGEPHRSRVRASLRNVTDLPDKDKVERFAQALRDEYRRGLEFLDAQAVRRLVRSYLLASHAIPVGSVYFVPEPEPVNQLCLLLEKVGGSEGYGAEIPNDAQHQGLVRRALTAAVQRDKVPEDTMKVYRALLREDDDG